MRLSQEKVLLIGDPNREVQSALIGAIPNASVTAVNDCFEAIAELSSNRYTAVLACTEPIERRPEAAIRALRELATEGRLVLFGQPSLEGLSRKMMEFGADDYFITPTSAAELQQIFGQPAIKRADNLVADDPAVAVSHPPSAIDILQSVPMTDILLDALVQLPADAVGMAVSMISRRIVPTMELLLQPAGQPSPQPSPGTQIISHALRPNSEETGQLHLQFLQDQDSSGPRHFLAQLASQIDKVGLLVDRHVKMQKLAITDQLTGVYNRRYFENFLERIIEKAQSLRFSVTLLLFDIDNFKKYNDTFGHGVGDQILKDTATLMRACCREHDLVSRMGGDEFAVVFWEKDGPRAPKDSKAALAVKPPQAPQQIFERFRRLIATKDFAGLGARGVGTLTISGGLATYPWDARDSKALLEAADRALIQGAKKGGKDRLVLVGGEGQPKPPETE